MTVDRQYVVFLDLDNTIIRVNSGKYLMRYAYEKGIVNKKDLLKTIYLSLLFKFKLRNIDRIIRDMAIWLKGLSEKRITKLTNEMFENRLVDTIHHEIYSEIEFHRKKNAKIVILSASIYPLCDAFVRHLDIDGAECSRLEIKNGEYTGYPVGNFCFAQEKRSRALQHCRDNNFDIKNAWYYADSDFDRHVLETVGFPVCVNPDKKLEKVAQQNNWIIKIWK